MERSLTTTFRKRQRKTLEIDKPRMIHGLFRHPPTLPTLPTLFALTAPPLVTLLGIWSWAAGQLDPTAAAEGRYLALVAAWVMACSAALALRAPQAGTARLALAAAAVLTITAVWVVPGPTRGAVVLVVLLTTVVVAAFWRLGPLPKDAVLPLPVALALALAAQAFCRGDRFLFSALDGSTAVALFVLPVVGGLAVWILSRQRGWSVALLAAGVVLVATPGWTTFSALGLLGIAAGGEWAAQRWALPGLLVALALVAGIGGRREALVVALVLLLLHFVLERKEWGWGAVLAVSGVLAVCGLGLLAFEGAAWEGLELRRGLLWLVLVPGLVPRLMGRGGGRWVVVALVAAGLALGLLPGRLEMGGLGLAAALLCTGLTSAERRRSAAPAIARTVQGGWILALLVATALLGGYPWLRPEPLVTLVDRGGGVWVWLGVLGVLGVGTAGLYRILANPRRWTFLLFWVPALVVLLLVLAPSLPRSLSGGTGRVLLTGETVILTAAEPLWAAPCGPGEMGEGGEILVDSSVAHGAALAAGTPVATVATVAGGAPEPLRLGTGTGEWAARRPGLVTAAPEPWLSTVAPEGAFFAQRYRVRLAVPPGDCRAVEIRRHAALPTAVTVTLFFVEVRPGG
jgi:hypothetical protein